MAKRLHTDNITHSVAPMSPAMVQRVDDVRSAAANVDHLLRIVADDLAAFGGRLRDQQVTPSGFAYAGDWDHFDILLSIARDQLRLLVKVANHEEEVAIES